MKIGYFFVYGVIAIAAVSCSTAQKPAADVTPTASQAGTEPSGDVVVRNYVVRERNPDPKPEWAASFGKFLLEKDAKGEKYFLGESGDVSDRMSGCEVASANARRKIAEAIANFISNKMAAVRSGQLFIDKNNPTDPGMRKHFESVLAVKALEIVKGTVEVDQFWEERDYSKSGGNKSVYQCQTLIKVSDKDFANTGKQAAAEAPKVLEDPEAKAEVKEALKGLDFKSYQPKASN